MAGSPVPAVNNLLDADGAVSPVRAAAQRRRRVSALTGCRRWRSRLHWRSTPRVADCPGRRWRNSATSRKPRNCRSGAESGSHLACTLGKGPDGRLAQRTGWPPQPMAHTVIHTPFTHITNAIRTRACNGPRQPLQSPTLFRPPCGTLRGASSACNGSPAFNGARRQRRQQQTPADRNGRLRKCARSRQPQARIQRNTQDHS